MNFQKKLEYLLTVFAFYVNIKKKEVFVMCICEDCLNSSNCEFAFSDDVPNECLEEFSEDMEDCFYEDEISY